MLRSILTSSSLHHVKTTLTPIRGMPSLVRSLTTGHSSTNATQPQEPQDVRQLLLQATLHHVPGHGWTMDSLARGAEDLGLPSVVHGVFPGGPSGLVDAYLEQCQRQFAQQAQDPMEGSISDRVRALTMLRLELLKPYARRWPEAVALLAVNPPTAFHHLSTLVDDIWFYAGDRSPDMNWYTKRAALATIYSATELYMSQDISPDFVETYRFLDRRLEEAEWVDGAASQLGTMLSFGAKSLIGSIAQSRGH